MSLPALALAGLALLAVAPPAPAQDAAAIVGRSSRVYRSLASMRADFVQVIDNPMIDSAESRGTLVQAGQSKLAMRFTDPPGEAIVIDGEVVVFGSFNFSESADRTNDENLLIVYNRDVAARFEEEFQKVVRQAREANP